MQWGEYGRYFRQPGLGIMLVQFLVFMFSFSMFVSALALFVERRITWHGKPFGPEQTGYVWAYAGLLGIGLQGPALGRLVKRFGERTLNRVGFAAYVSGYSMLAFAHSIPWLLLSTTVLAHRRIGAPDSHQHDHAKNSARGAGHRARPDAIADLRFADRRAAHSRIAHSARPAYSLGASARGS